MMKKLSFLFGFFALSALFSCAVIEPDIILDPVPEKDPSAPNQYPVNQSYIDNQGNFQPGSGWKLVWSDEFNAPTIDNNNWVFDIGRGVNNDGWGNWEDEYYTDRPENAFISNDNLVIKAIKESYNGYSYTSARLKTQGKFSWKYGKIVGRIKMPVGGKGIWPAFWMLGDNFNGNNWPSCGEMDIMEMFGTDNSNANAAAHWGTDYNHHSYTTGIIYPGKSLSDLYHYYEMEWNATNITIRIDAVRYYSCNTASLSEFNSQPAFILLNLAVGAMWNNIGHPDASVTFPQAMIVDWVRVYQTENNPDNVAPTVSVTAPVDNQNIASAGTVTVYGTASDNLSVEGVYLSLDGSFFSKIATGNSWGTNLNLDNGQHLISVYSQDYYGNLSATKNVLVNVGGGDYKPEIVFNRFPAIGSFENTGGKVYNANPSLYKIVLFIRVNNNWWVKPYGNNSFSAIGSDGSWSCDYTTGGIDQTADYMIAFLVSSTFNQSDVGLFTVSNASYGFAKYNRKDTTAPACTVTSPSGNQKWYKTVYSVTGTAKDESELDGVYFSLNNSGYSKVPGTKNWNANSINWQTNIVLNTGDNTVNIYSQDNGGNNSGIKTSVITYIYDAVKPVVAVDTPVEGTTLVGSITISGTASDENELEGVYISVDGSTFAKAAGTTSWSATFSPLTHGAHKIRVYSRDKADNISDIREVNVSYYPNESVTCTVTGTATESYYILPTLSDWGGVGTGDFGVAHGNDIWSDGHRSATLDIYLGDPSYNASPLIHYVIDKEDKESVSKTAYDVFEDHLHAYAEIYYNQTHGGCYHGWFSVYGKRMLTGAMNRVNIDQNSTGYYETYLYPPAGTVAHSWDRGVIYNGGSDAGTYIDAANNRLVIRVNLNGHYRAAYCLYAKVPATQTVTKTVTFTSTVNKFEGLKQLGTFDAAPSPNRGGTLSGFSYSVSDNNANVSTYIDGNRVMGQTTY